MLLSTDPLQAATVEERHRHGGSVVNVFRALERNALLGGGVAQLDELPIGGKELHA